MSKSAVISTRLDEETLAQVDKIVEASGRSRAWFAARAIREIAQREADFLAFVQEGINAADRGELIPHDEVVERIYARRRARSSL
jgi:predicted transcriptional regulator